MPLKFSLDDLLAYTEWERGQWLTWFRANGGQTLAVDLGPNNTGRFGNVGELIRHMFSAETRYVERCLKRPLTDATTVPADDVEALFAFGEASGAPFANCLRRFRMPSGASRERCSSALTPVR
jgi:hypothetical protein